MAYTSLADARTKLMDPTKEHESVILYGSDNTLSSTTTFYTDSDKTLIAPAGNYVIPTNYKSYYLTLNSSGKIVGSPQELSSSLYDKNWVDDSIYGEYGTKDSNTNWFNSGERGGTQLVLNTSSLLLTDQIFTSRPPQEEVFDGPTKISSNTYKLWTINGATKYTSSLTNIDLSDMKGYDLQIMMGNWEPDGTVRKYKGVNDTPGYTRYRNQTITATVHLADDPNRVSITGSLIYTFKPDYFFPTASYNGMSYYRRLPDVLPLYNSDEVKKEWIEMVIPNGDIWYKGSTPNSITRVRRTPTRFKKGPSVVFPFPSKKYPNDNNPSTGDNIFYYESDYLTNPYDKFIMESDEWIRDAYKTGRKSSINWSSIGHSAQAYALMRSLTVDNDTWENGSTAGINYRDINQYHWTTQVNSGTDSGKYDNSPANKFLNFIQYNNCKVRNLNQEEFGSYTQDYYLGLAFNECIQNSRNYAVTNSLVPSGGYLNQQLGYYEGGIYNSAREGNNGFGWGVILQASSLSDAKTKRIHQDYHQYYINGTQTWQDTQINDFFLNAIHSFDQIYISTYHHYISVDWLFYAFVQNCDITKKILIDMLGAETAKTKRVMSYFWHLIEPLQGTDIDYERKGYNPFEIRTESQGVFNRYSYEARLQVSPSTMQSIAVWSFAYADGMFHWSYKDAGCEDKEAYDWWAINYYNRNIGDPDVQENREILESTFGTPIDRNFGSNDWMFIGYRQVLLHKDIVGASTSWLKPELYWNGAWLTGENNYPSTLCYQKAPISAYKLSEDGTEALLIITNSFNNGYTKASHRLRLPAKSNREFTIDTWGTYTTVIRIKNL